MPLKVSSQGWVKVAPPPPRPRRRVDPEEQKEAFCSPLRYFACQAVDPSRERLRMLGGRTGFSSSEADLFRPHSRLERHSTLEEWRFEARPSRSSSRQSGNILESSSPPKMDMDREGGSSSHRSRRRGLEDGSQQSERNRDELVRGDRHEASKPKEFRTRDRASSAPVIIPVSPPPSVYDETQESLTEEVDQVEAYPDNVSVAYTETPSERHCRHNHRHRQSRKAPSAILEEEEPESVVTSATSLAATAAPLSPAITGGSEICARRHVEDKTPVPGPIPAPPPTIARSDTAFTRKTEVEIPSPIPESSPLEIPTKALSHAGSVRSESLDRSDTRSEVSHRSRRSERSERSSKSSRSSASSKSSASSRSTDTYRSRRTESESDYSESVRSASPARDHHYKYKDDDTSTYYPSPPSSPPPPTTRRSRYEPQKIEAAPTKPRNRVVTAPASTSKPSPALSASSWSSGSSVSSRSTRSSAPSIDGYQFQAAIFQPKHYQGYRAPSLSKGNRWETATSALSFD